MDEIDTGKRAETPKRPMKVSGGTAEDRGDECQASTARFPSTKDEASTLIEQALCRENVQRAYERVVRNGGAAGVDGVTVDELMPYCRERWARIREEILSGRYVPQPVRKVEIPKPGGGVRMLGIPTVLDRMIQQALLQVLQPIFEPHFSEGSFGFRPGRNAHMALRTARAHIQEGHRYVVDLDLEKFFDRVHHDVLMSRVARRVEDKPVLRLIRRYLQAGILADGVVSPRVEGTPQGGPLSPLLSNILLDDLDKELERRGHRFVRYADDCNVYVRSRKAGQRVMESLTQFLEQRLKLRVNQQKSAVARPWQRKFLGYSFTWHKEAKLKVAPESIKRLKQKLRHLFRQGRGRSLRRVIEELRPVIIGWTSYYRLSEVKGIFEQLDGWLRRKLRCILWRQWKRPRTRAKKLQSLGLSEAHASISACNGHGPWWNAGATHMHIAVPTSHLRSLRLTSFLDEHRRFACIS